MAITPPLAGPFRDKRASFYAGLLRRAGTVGTLSGWSVVRLALTSALPLPFPTTSLAHPIFLALPAP